MEKVNVKIKGISAILMHSFPLAPIESPPLEKRSIEEQAELAAYRDPDSGELYVPGQNVYRALVAAAAYSKGKGRASLQRSAAAGILIGEERLSLKKKTYTIDSRRVVVPATKGAVIRHRPRLDNWELSFAVEWDSSLMTEKQLRTILDDAGSKVGLLDYRPEKKGPFGRFMVTGWTVVKE